jgi:hypothetical protein
LVGSEFGDHLLVPVIGIAHTISSTTLQVGFTCAEDFDDRLEQPLGRADILLSSNVSENHNLRGSGLIVAQWSLDQQVKRTHT